MDQIDYTSRHNDDLSLQYAQNYINRFHQQNNEDNIPSNLEQEENDQSSTSFIYKKRVRTKFTQDQLDVLESTFQDHRYPSVSIVDDLVEQLNLSTQKITVWFQNRRARLKKSQQKLEKNDQKQYDSGIHLDEDISHESSVSPPMNPLPQLPSPPTTLMTAPSSSYYLPNSHLPFYNPMWSNFHYPLSAPSLPSSMNFMHYNPSDLPPPFVFQDVSNYQYHHGNFHDEL
ncbi:hypothetical protein I4U23_021203 [Adineta vaga]|nr:hypothetical protein I4U23_021203 [Adineta vaga]